MGNEKICDLYITVNGKKIPLPGMSELKVPIEQEKPEHNIEPIQGCVTFEFKVKPWEQKIMDSNKKVRRMKEKQRRKAVILNHVYSR